MNNALRAVADELRRDRMNKLEEKAVKLPAQLIFPLIFLIMPSLYVVLLGPSFMQLYDALKVVTHSLHH
jgi:tight adherence protein C